MWLAAVIVISILAVITGAILWVTYDYYVNPDGSFQEGTHVLVPAWIVRQFN